MIRLTKTGFVADAEDVERLRSEFEKNHLVQIRGLLDPQVVALVLSHIEHGHWREISEPGFASDYELELGPVLELLNFVCNAPNFLETIRKITGCKPLTWFEGRVFTLAPDVGHVGLWHNDNAEGRVVAMTVNLSPRGYQGGLFQMRETKSHRMLVEIANTGLGDAIIFPVSGDFQHRVSEVQTGEAKTAFAGWFHVTEQSLRARLSRHESPERVR